MNTKGKNYIDGKWVDADSGQSFESRSPTDTAAAIGTFPRSSEADVDHAVEVACRAFRPWRQLSRIKRGEYFDAFVQLVKADHEALARLMAREAGKPLNEARADVTEGIHMAQFVFGTTRMPHGDILSSEIADKDTFMRRRPKGVVAAITPWNFPFAVPLWLIGPSLVEGNTVVFKPSEETPAVGEKLVDYFDQVGLPPGVLNLVQGIGEEVGRPLVRHPEVAVLLFTGSYEVGSEIKAVCAQDFRKMAACEMGGKNALIICDDARRDLALNASLLSAFKTSGQRCVSAGRLIVHESLLEDFCREFVQLAQRLVIGDPLDERTLMGPVINAAGLQKIVAYNDLARAEGAEVLLDGGQLRGGLYDRGYFLSPFIYRLPHSPTSRVLREEVFGPHVAIIPFRTLEEAIAIYNDTDYGLAMAVITEDYRKARRVREECEYGLGYVNLPCIGAEVHLPFGGLKKSGTGLPSASTLIDAVTHRVAWTVNHGDEIRMAQGLSASIA